MHPLKAAVALAIATVGLTIAALGVIPAEKICPDFICFWTAGELLAEQQSPYDATLETQKQLALGWDKETDGIGLYEFLPYFYPPWFGLLIVPLLPLGYATAKIAWLVINAELLLASGYLLRRCVPSLPRLVPVILVGAFSLSVFAVLMGQTAPLILFLIVATWRLLLAERDWTAGAVLAWLTIKPQVTVILLPALFLWAIRRKRWGLLGGFGTTLLALGLASALVVPMWPLEMLRATGRNPLPTDYFPWFGTTWLLVLKTLGLRSWLLWAGYLAVAGPLVGLVLKRAWSPSGRLKDVISLAALAAFFVAPYAQPYDFPVLLLTVLALADDWKSELAKTALVVAMIIVPYLHIFYAKRVTLWWLPPKPTHQVTIFWVPLLVLGLWLATSLRQRPAAQPVAEPELAECVT